MAKEKEQAHHDAAHLILGGQGALYPADEAQYWREAHAAEPYFEAGRHFEDYGPAYELGWTGYHNYGGEFETADRVLANDWIVCKGVSTLSWDQARPACRAAWQRAHNAGAYATDGSAARDEVVEVLTLLVDNARDGELGYAEAAEHTQTPELAEFFGRRAQTCRRSAAELIEQLQRLDGQVETEGGTMAAAAHRVWLQIRGLFGGATDETILQECERGEDAALSGYHKALGQNLPPAIHALVQCQLETTQRNRDMIRTLLERSRVHAPDAASPDGEPGLPQRGSLS